MAEPNCGRKTVYRPPTTLVNPFHGRPANVVDAMAGVPSSTPGMKSLKGIVAGLLRLSRVISVIRFTCT